ncbi:MAG: hypothetical protein JNM40_26145 [Myxococcales bacterium]|nr:hypothetical protein [Myxococcales bacterium]
MRIDRPLLAVFLLSGLGDVAAAEPVAAKSALKPSAAAKSAPRSAGGTASPVLPKTSPPVLPPVLPPPPVVTPAQEIVPASGGLGNDLLLAPLPPPLPPVRREPKQIRLGALIWAAGYLPALIAPLLLWPRVDTPDGPSALANYSLLVPLIGPYISAIAAPAQAEEGNGRAVLSAWSVPWLLTSGLLQTTGFVLLLHGALPRLRASDDVALIPTGNGAAVIGRF